MLFHIINSMWKYFLLAFTLVGAAFAQASTNYWIDGEYLLWRIKNNPIPIPLVTSASYADPLPGAIGQPHTRVVLGEKSIDMGWMQGFQVDAGAWIKHNIGIEGSYFLLPTVSQTKSLSTSGNLGSPNYAVPIFDVSGVFGLNGVPGETIFILPGPFMSDPGFSATYILHLTSQLQSAELNGLYRIINKKNFQFECSGGFRWLQLYEKLLFKANSLAVPGSIFGHAFYNTRDRFETTNNFLAGQLNIDARYRTKKWHLDALLKGALGAVLQKVKIEGSSQTSNGNLFFETMGTGNTILPGGIFAEPSNIGSHRKSPMAWSFETKVKTGYAITKHIEIHLGYTFLWISRVLRPGNQIDRKINSTRTALADASRATVGIGPGPIPFGGPPGPAPAASGPVRPKALFRSATFWAQGLDAGIQFNF